MKNTLCIVSLLFCVSLSIAQEKKSLNIQRTSNPPKIDGVLDDDAWKGLEIANDFVQFRPEMGVPETAETRTEVKVTYDDDAIYFSAYLYDDPSKIMSQFTSRDNFGQNDFFMLILNPNNDAQNNTMFVVFSSGTQADAVATLNNEDFGWNAVWDSAVKINDDGWAVEMKIPYRALRFENQDIQTWGVQFHREFRRDRSRYTWNPIDATKGSTGLYHGELTGIENIEPPVRLNLYPFASGLVNTFDGDTDTDLNFGLDVKYGITENFTLDATLIPDFSQAGFDNLVLNLGPFEQTFSEQRQFFTEGVDLFNKGNLFFSRRVGGGPSAEIELNENEDFVDYPNDIKVLNAVKVSGRTKKGLGVGVFNSITEKTDVTIKNSITGATRQQTVEPFANYNIIVLDQQFNQNSSISLVNTNVLREGNFRDANVTALIADISNKRNTYNIDGQVKMSNLNLSDGTQTGYSSFFAARKTHGNLRYSFYHSYADTKYDINDLGLQFRNNFNNFGADVWYQTFEPSGKLNNYSINGYFNYRKLANPNTFTGTNFGFNYRAQTKNLNFYRFRLNIEPGKQYDYFEAREDGKFFIYENVVSAGGSFSSNYNKKFALDIEFNAATLFEDGRDLVSYEFEFRPRVRISNHFLLTYGLELNINNGSRGYASELNEEPVFGERNRQILENSISANYNFNPFHSLNLVFRNYWDTVRYDDKLFTLLDTGRLSTNEGITTSDLDENPDVNFSTWNLDLSYSWQFAPGSFLTALYRNQLFNIDDNSNDSYRESLSTLFEQPIQHTFSLRLQYFIDYSNIKSIFTKKSS